MQRSGGVIAPPKKKARTNYKVSGKSNQGIPPAVVGTEEAGESTEAGAPPATTIKFQCKVCKRYFVDKAEFDEHSKRHKKSKFKCMVCQFTSFGATAVMRHVRRMHPTILVKFKCDECEEEFVSNNQLRSHKKLKHCNVCEICGKEFEKRKYLLFHKKMRHTKTYNKKYKCINCSKTFAYPHMLKKHEDRYQGKCYSESMLPETESFICGLCKKVFVELDAFQKHEQLHKEMPYECPMCHVPSVSLPSLKQHLNKFHVDKPKKVLFSCELCGKSYTRVTGLNEHIINVHNGPRVYMCVICNTSCTDRRDLERHRGIHFECLHCAKRHRSQNLLFKHQMKCELKNKNYSGKNNVKAIFENTESMMPFADSSGGIGGVVSCPVCKEFVLKALLVDHLCTHGQKPNDKGDLEKQQMDETNASLSDSENSEVYQEIRVAVENNSDEDDFENLDVVLQDQGETSREEVEYKKPCIIKL